jgi:hypothetical protein
MRFILYWLTSTSVAVLCMKAAATPHAETDVIAAVDPVLGLTGTDPTRAIMLGVGIMAMAYTYQRVWANFRTAEKRA